MPNAKENPKDVQQQRADKDETETNQIKLSQLTRLTVIGAWKSTPPSSIEKEGDEKEIKKHPTHPAI